MTDTIAAIATAGGVGSIAIVRLSGPDAVAIARSVAPTASFQPRQADLASLYDQETQLIDQGIVLHFAAPRSFTGESVVEFQCHGGDIIAQAILSTLLHYGARLAEPGEFTRRAFLNAKIDLTKAEAIAKMIEARSTDAAHILARQLKGELSTYIQTLRDDLLRALAHSEVMIDYAEEVSDELILPLRDTLTHLRDDMRRIVESSRRRQGLLEGFRVAIVGKPNVGKSSLLNALLDYDRAIVSAIAGTTRDTIEESVRLGSHLIRLIDTAGIRQATDAIEQIGVERSLASIAQADLIVALFDASRPFDEEDAHILDALEHHADTPLLIVYNKTDLPRALSSPRLDAYTPIAISALHRATPLIDAITEHCDRLGREEDILLISTRQIQAVERAWHAIEASIPPLEEGELEFFSYHIQEAITHIGSITDPYESEEILDQMFGEFCLGK